MKLTKALLLFSFIAFLMFSCKQQGSDAYSLVVETDPAMEGSVHTLSIPVETLIAQGMPADMKTPWQPYDAEGKAIPAQYEDLDQDGKAEHLVFQAASGEKISFKAAEAATFPMKTNLHIGKRSDGKVESVKKAQRLQTGNNKITYANFQYEGIGWENDIVGFRNYLDLRNGIDIFGKRVSEMVLDEVDREENSHYHELSDWGMDVLKVGTSLGAGSVGLIYKDSLIRLTSEDADAVLVDEGPVKSSFIMNFRNVDLGDKKIDVSHTVSIAAGNHYYEGKLDFSDASGLTVVAGIVDLHDAEFEVMEAGQSVVMNSFGAQSENKDVLSMALLVDKDIYKGPIDSDDFEGKITDTKGLSFSAENAVYRFYALWEMQDESFKEKSAVLSFLKKEAELQATRVNMSWKK